MIRIIPMKTEDELTFIYNSSTLYRVAVYSDGYFYGVHCWNKVDRDWTNEIASFDSYSNAIEYAEKLVS